MVNHRESQHLDSIPQLIACIGYTIVANGYKLDVRVYVPTPFAI